MNWRVALFLFALAQSAQGTLQGPPPTRDLRAVTNQVGTGRLTGRVVSDTQTPAPVRRAIVTMRGAELPAGRSAITDDDGKFTIDNLPSGRFTVVASKPAWLSAAYGARRPGRAGTPIAIGATPLNLTLRMARGAAIGGVIRDARGVPATGVQVVALNVRAFAAGAPVDADRGTVVTDDRGAYRLFGLMPGDYVVMASKRMPGAGEIAVRPDDEIDQLLADARRGVDATVLPGQSANLAAERGAKPPRRRVVTYAPSYYPNATTVEAAGRITLQTGDERNGVDFSLSPVPVARIAGRILDVAGQPVASVQLSLIADGPRLNILTSGMNPQLSQPPGADGEFVYSNMPPGRYTIVARARERAGPTINATAGGRGGASGASSTTVVNGGNGLDVLFASAEVVVNGQDIDGVAMTLLPGTNISGRVVFPSGAAVPDLSRLSVQAAILGGSGMSSSGGTTMGTAIVSVPGTQVEADGRFTITGVGPYTYLLAVNAPAEISKVWGLRSAMLNGRDLLDAPFEVRAGADFSGLEITFSDRRTEVTGRLQSAEGQPAPDYFVVALPADPALRVAGSRRIQSTRPASDGAFSIANLPPGEYLLAALTDLEPLDLRDRVFLDQLAAGGIAITLADGEKKTQDLRIGG